jgi:two-component system cell cycle response regulator DivK
MRAVPILGQARFALLSIAHTYVTIEATIVMPILVKTVQYDSCTYLLGQFTPAQRILLNRKFISISRPTALAPPREEPSCSLSPRLSHPSSFNARNRMAHILIIDDSPDNREVTEQSLLDAGHTIISASDGFNGLHMAEYNQPDLIVIDLVLALLDGWETTRRLKANPATWHIPVVACTAHNTPGALSHTLTAGCEAVIAKPFDLDTLLMVITALLVPCASQARQRSVGIALVE